MGKTLCLAGNVGAVQIADGVGPDQRVDFGGKPAPRAQHVFSLDVGNDRGRVGEGVGADNGLRAAGDHESVRVVVHLAVLDIHSVAGTKSEPPLRLPLFLGQHIRKHGGNPVAFQFIVEGDAVDRFVVKSNRHGAYPKTVLERWTGYFELEGVIVFLHRIVGHLNAYGPHGVRVNVFGNGRKPEILQFESVRDSGGGFVDFPFVVDRQRVAGVFLATYVVAAVGEIDGRVGAVLEHQPFRLPIRRGDIHFRIPDEHVVQ